MASDPSQHSSAPRHAPPAFDPGAEHHRRPKLRPVRGFPAKHGEQTLLGLADARQISDQVVFTAPAAQLILPHMNGKNDLDTIVAAVGRGLTRGDLEMLVAQLDNAFLLEGPPFNALLSKLRAQFDSAPNLPPASSANVADALVVQKMGESATDEQKAEHGPRLLREAMDSWISHALKEVENPSFDALPRAVVAPHLDYGRGWLNYAHVYGRLRVVDKPDRIIILGTNHFGHGTGVCGCDKGYSTPLGSCEVDSDFLATLRGRLGAENSRLLFEHRYDHEREHSIELHIPWIQHVFGVDDQGRGPKVFAALVHDPAANNGESYDGTGLGILPFIDAMKQAIREAPGRTLVVSSADLSHVGASFGDKISIVGDDPRSVEFRNSVLQADQELLGMVAQGKAEELVSSMAWRQNSTRWCSVGNLVAMMKIVEADKVDILNYTMAGDQQGVAMVSSCAAVVR